MPVLVAAVVPAGSQARRTQPVLTTAGLIVRPWLEADVPGLVLAYEDPQIRHWHCRSMTEDEALSWVQTRAARWSQETGADWAVTATGQVLGRIGLRTLDLAAGYGEVAYWMLPAVRGRGTAVRALQVLTRWSLDELGLHRLELAHSTRNQASCRVAVKAGFPLEATERSQALHADGWHDMHLHARVQGDPR